MKKAIVLVSGGVDSSTVLAMVKNMGYEIYALSFYYEQRHRIELEKIQSFLEDYSVKLHKIVKIDLATFGGSALTDSSIEVPKYNSAAELQNDIPITYVPARNTIFLSYALAFAEVIEAHDIFIGVHATDHSNYPDCREEYIASFETMANLATRIGSIGKKITIHAPLINMTKTKIIETGLKLGVDYSKTISCYEPNYQGYSCGSCLACLVRINGFKENNIEDPIKYSVT